MPVSISKSLNIYLYEYITISPTKIIPTARNRRRISIQKIFIYKKEKMKQSFKFQDYIKNNPLLKEEDFIDDSDEEAGKSKTNSEELQKTEDLLAQAYQDNNYSTMSSHEYRIKFLKILNVLEKKYSKALPVFTQMSVIDYINDNFPGFKEKFGPYKQNWRAVIDHIEKSLGGSAISKQ
jgi:hypothetical protein